jgi:O-methyltransferase
MVTLQSSSERRGSHENGRHKTTFDFFFCGLPPRWQSKAGPGRVLYKTVWRTTKQSAPENRVRGRGVVTDLIDWARLLHHRYFRILRSSMKSPTYSKETAHRITGTGDPIRYASLALALETIERERVPGSLAELGVWRGTTSQFIHAQLPHRRLYLFDTFTGFPNETGDNADIRFRDTSVETVRRKIGDTGNVCFRVGHFPDTAQGLESEMFAFVLLDMDKYEPTLAGLEFFYPRVPHGGYVFIHDYNNPESDRGVFRSVNHFLSDKAERVIEIPDSWGSVIFRKLSPQSTGVG